MGIILQHLRAAFKEIGPFHRQASIVEFFRQHYEQVKKDGHVCILEYLDEIWNWMWPETLVRVDNQRCYGQAKLNFEVIWGVPAAQEVSDERIS